jgi:hypothetical protein
MDTRFSSGGVPLPVTRMTEGEWGAPLFLLVPAYNVVSWSILLRSRGLRGKE